MPEILNTIGQTIDDIVNSQAVQITGRLIFIYLVVLWIASAYWAYRDMQQRSDNAILPYLVAAGIILFTPFLFFLAVWVYKIIRPHERSARSGNGTLRRKRSSTRSRPSRTARHASDVSIPNGSSARPAGPASTASARTAHGSSVSIGHCARGAARTSSGVMSWRRG